MPAENHTNWIKNSLPYLAFFVLSVIVMFPAVINMSQVMYGLPGDPYFRIWENWYFKYAFLHHEPLYFSRLIGATFGVDLTIVPYHVFWDKLFFITTLLSNEVFSYNLFIFLSFFLSGAAMYHLSFYITKKRGIGLFSAILYMFCPYHLARSVGHITLSNIQWLPLFILFTLKLSESYKLKNTVLLGLSLGLVFISEYYYGIFSYQIFFIFLLPIIFINKIKITKKLISRFFIAILISAVVIVIFILPVYLNNLAKYSTETQTNTAITHSRPAKEIFAGTARPLSYLLPSYMHPFFGKFTELFIGSPLYGESKTENSLYLGIFPLILSWMAIRSRTKISKIFLCLFIASILLSLPPYIKIFHMLIPLPSFFIFKIVPRIRVYARFGVFAMLAVSVLAGIGLKEFMARAGDNRKKRYLYAFSLAIIFIEFLVNPLKYKTDLSHPPGVYKWLSQQKGDFIICEYPLAKDLDMRADWLIWQRIHEKRKIDGALPGSRTAKFWKYILRLQDKDTPGILKWLGAKYVIVHLEDMKKSETVDIVGVLPDFSKQEGLKLIKKFEDIEVYEVIAKPLNPEAG